MDEEKQLHDAVVLKRVDELEAQVELLWKRLDGINKELDAREDYEPWWAFWRRL